MKPKTESKKYQTRGRRQSGFSLVELLVAGFLGAIVLAATYLFFIANTQQYYVQEQVVQMQENMRFALEYIKNDLRGAGRLTVVNAIEPTGGVGSTGRDPRFCPTRTNLRAVELIENAPETPNILTRFQNNLRPDRLRLLVDRSDGIVYTSSRLNGRTFTLRRSDQRTQDARAGLRKFMYFAPRAFLHVVSPSGQSDLVPVEVRERDDDEVELALLADLCPAGDPSLSSECAAGGCLVTPVQHIEYAVLASTPEFELAPQTPAATFLVRRALDPVTGEAEIPGMVLAPFAVDLQIWATYDTRRDNLAGDTRPIIPVDPDPTDDKGNWVTDTESEILNVTPHRVRGLNIMLAIRTPREDEGFVTAPDRDLPLGDRLAADRTWFDASNTPESGFARVMTMQTEVETPNMYRGQ